MSFPVQNLIVQKRTAKRKAGPLDAPVALYNPDGTPFTGAGGDAPTTIPTGALIPGAGISLVRGEDGELTASVKDGGVTAGMIADGVIGADKLTANAVSELKAIPAATPTALGGVKQGVAVPNLADDADAAAIVSTVNSLLTQLRAAGVIAATK